MKKKSRGEMAIELARDGRQPKRGLLEKMAQVEVARQLRKEVERKSRSRV